MSQRIFKFVNFFLLVILITGILLHNITEEQYAIFKIGMIQSLMGYEPPIHLNDQQTKYDNMARNMVFPTVLLQSASHRPSHRLPPQGLQGQRADYGQMLSLCPSPYSA